MPREEDSGKISSLEEINNRRIIKTRGAKIEEDKDEKKGKFIFKFPENENPIKNIILSGLDEAPLRSSSISISMSGETKSKQSNENLFCNKNPFDNNNNDNNNSYSNKDNIKEKDSIFSKEKLINTIINPFLTKGKDKDDNEILYLYYNFYYIIFLLSFIIIILAETSGGLFKNILGNKGIIENNDNNINTKDTKSSLFGNLNLPVKGFLFDNSDIDSNINTNIHTNIENKPLTQSLFGNATSNLFGKNKNKNKFFYIIK